MLKRPRDSNQGCANYGVRSTATNKQRVTAKKRRQRAHEVAMKLNDTDRWHSHGHGISMEVLRRELNLIIDDFEQDPNINQYIRNYCNLLDDYMLKMRHETVIHMIGLYKSVMG